MQARHVKPFGTKSLLKDIKGDAEFANVAKGQLDAGVNETNNKTESYGQEIYNSGDDSKGNPDKHALPKEGLDSVQQLNVFEVTLVGKRKHEGCSFSGNGSKNPLSVSEQNFLFMMLMINPRGLKSLMRDNIV
jgi:hypothetical protein